MPKTWAHHFSWPALEGSCGLPRILERAMGGVEGGVVMRWESVGAGVAMRFTGAGVAMRPDMVGAGVIENRR